MKKIILLPVFGILLAAAVQVRAAAVTRPTTQVVVSHPQTAVTASHPVTQGAVSRPSSAGIVVSHPTSSEPAAPAGAAASGKNEKVSPAAGTKGVAAVNEIPSSKSATSMSGFQGKQATDFKAAQGGKTSFDLGGGKDDSGKNNAAKNSNAFKGLGGDLDKAMKQGHGGASRGKVSNAIKSAMK